MANNDFGLYVLPLLRQTLTYNTVVSLPSNKPYFLWVEDHLWSFVRDGRYFPGLEDALL